MKISEVLHEGNKVSYEVSIPNLDVENDRKIRLQKLSAKIKIDGFRKGKVPLSVVESRYKDAVLADMIEDFLNMAIRDVVKDRKLVPMSQPKAEVMQFDKEGLKLKLDFELFPKVESLELGSIVLQRYVVNIPAEEIQEALERLASYHSVYKDVKKKGPLALNDVAVIDFIGSVNGKEFTGGKGEDVPLQLGSRTFIEGFEDQLVGKNVDEDVEVNVTFPSSYNDAELAEKDAVFKVRIKKLQEAVPATIDDDLAKKAGCKNLDELKTHITKRYENELQGAERNRLIILLDQQLKESCKVDIPSDILEKEKQSMWAEFLESRKQINPEDIARNEMYTKNDDEVKQLQAKQAYDKLKLSFILGDFAREHNISVDQSDVNKLLKQESHGMRGENMSNLFKYYEQNPELMQMLKNTAMKNKIYDLLLEKVNYKDEQLTFEEYKKIFLQK